MPDISWGYVIITILVIAGVTLFTRAFPFLLFGRKTNPPAYVIYLGQVLPPAVIAMLIIYCLRNISFTAFPFGLAEIISVIAIVIIHVWKRNNLISIFGGTILYMILIQYVFV